MKFIYNEKALMLGESIIIADVHLGLEYELRRKGVIIQSQLDRQKTKILNLIEVTGAKKLVILGDLKHNIPGISWQEYSEIPKFYKELSKFAEIVIIKGNHDGNIEKLLPGIKIFKEIKLGNTLLTHGHMSIKSTDCDVIVGHSHPCIEFREFGRSLRESAWIKAKFNSEGRKLFKGSIIIIPAFNDLIRGIPFNSSEPLVGSLFVKGLVDIDNSEAFLLDGTALGKIRYLKTSC